MKEVSSGMKVCSFHFCKNDYVLPNVKAIRKRLKTTAVPSLNLPHNENTTIKERNIRVLNRNLQNNKVEENLKPDESILQHEDALLDNEHEDLEIFFDGVSTMAANDDLEVTTDDGQHALACNCKRLKKNAEVQYQTIFFKQNLSHFLTNHEKLKTMPAHLIPVIENIFSTICATVNLGSPIIKDDKFMNP
ncbi:hypothetical protein PV328_011786 [Microctonus aethiopoides]|uniref:THAP-type domain-containing protein n=1 Tax=Microctonus aethiopoides TaxID=144406 RepID=A0AA39KQB0_9HYME|nr:hypothetical protein PV328_011786 [Microctonus aethiopoides]